MPVNTLLCEGGDNSPDVRVLLMLLAGRCEVRAAGGKYGLPSRVLAQREAIASSAVYCLRDGDFREDWDRTHDTPESWQWSEAQVHIGWSLMRKEVENYLVDPEVVSRALGAGIPDLGVYRQALKAARDRITIYQAARTALSSSRLRFRPLESSFGRPRGQERHLFPDVLDEPACIGGIRQVVAAHQETQVVEATDVERRFADLLPAFQPTGTRFRDYLYTFAGKDLLVAMDADVRGFGFDGAWAFREAVVKGIERSDDNPSTWLAEWGALLQIVESCE